MKHELFVWAHRGASDEAPENTMSAFKAAAAAGADGIELDVHLSRDGIPVVIHDEILDRTTDGRGPVRGMKVGDIRRLNAGIWFKGSFSRERVPLLEDVLRWAGNGIRINIEVKDPDAAQPVLELVRAYHQVRVLLSSFNPRTLEHLREADSDLPLGFLCDSRSWRSLLRRAEKCRAESFHPRTDLVSRPLVTACRRRGLAVYPWTVDLPGEVRSLRRLGVGGIFTNRPAEIVRSLRRQSQRANPLTS